MILACETFISLSEEDFLIIGITTATSVLPRIAWGLIMSYHNAGSGNYSDWSKLLGIGGGAYTAEETAMLKKFYRELSKIFHPDKNLDIDTHAEMVLLNRLKKEWGI